jgi:hypothetical protein
MDIPKKGVTMEDVNTAHALRKAWSGTEEEETGLSIFLYFSCMPYHYSRNTSNTIVFFVDSPGNLCVSMRDYYCYKFQIWPGIFNPILYGQRLF